MNRIPISRSYAMTVAERLRSKLAEKNIPMRQMFIFGSAIRGKTHTWSDIDIAVICDPFLTSQMDEMHACSREGRSIDPRVEVVYFHPDDMNNKYSTIVQEVKRYGISV